MEAIARTDSLVKARQRFEQNTDKLLRQGRHFLSANTAGDDVGDLGAQHSISTIVGCTIDHGCSNVRCYWEMCGSHKTL